jgi:hypothetical protein
LHRNCLRCRVPRRWRRYCLQRQGNPNVHFRGLGSRGIRSRRFAVYGYAIVRISPRPSQYASLNVLRLSIAAKRMAAQNVLVKDLQGVETLGAFLLFFLSDIVTYDYFSGSVGSIAAY